MQHRGGYKKSNAFIKVSYSTHRLIVVLRLCFVFALPDLVPQISHVNTFIIFRNGSKFLVEPSIFKNPESKHVRRSYYPYVSCVCRVSVVLQSKCWCTKSVYVSHAVRTSGSRTSRRDFEMHHLIYRYALPRLHQRAYRTLLATVRRVYEALGLPNRDHNTWPDKQSASFSAHRG
jgi:hypothetical protein